MRGEGVDTQRTRKQKWPDHTIVRVPSTWGVYADVMRAQIWRQTIQNSALNAVMGCLAREKGYKVWKRQKTGQTEPEHAKPL